jgi:3-deoxy-D-manno-octulosonic-acid transferase
MIILYRLLKWLLTPLVFMLMLVRIWRGREDRDHFNERLGKTETPRPDGPLLWVHGASVGEVVSHLVVLEKVRRARPSLNLLLTTGTINGRKMLERRAPHLFGVGHTFIQYVPLEVTAAARSFFKHWRPTVSVFTESDFWPELLLQAPHPILLNGRISDRSYRRYKKIKWFMRPLLRRLVLALAQRPEDATRLKKLGAKTVQVGGNLKFDAAPLPVDNEAVEKMRTALQGRPTLVVASTHEGEEERAAALHMQLAQKVPDLLTVLVPRHPHRGTQAANAALRATKAVKRRGLGENPTLGGARHTEVYIADTLGELGMWYRLADAVIMGGSLEKIGGHNPLEPLKLGIPTLCGPYMYNFKDMMPSLLETGALLQTNTRTAATTDAALYATLLGWFTDTDSRRAHIAKIKAALPTLTGSSTLAAAAILAQLDEALAAESMKV